MGAISKIVEAGVKKLKGKPAGGNTEAHVADLRRRIAEYERMLKNKEYGKGHVMTKDGIETRLAAHKKYLAKGGKDKRVPSARTTFGGKKKRMATKIGQTKRGLATEKHAREIKNKENMVDRVKKKRGKSTRTVNESENAYTLQKSSTEQTNLSTKDPAKYDKANQAAANAVKQEAKQQKELKNIKETGTPDRSYDGKKAGAAYRKNKKDKSTKVMEGRDFVAKGAKKKQATKKSKQELKKVQRKRRGETAKKQYDEDNK